MLDLTTLCLEGYPNNTFQKQISRVSVKVVPAQGDGSVVFSVVRLIFPHLFRCKYSGGKFPSVEGCPQGGVVV